MMIVRRCSLTLVLCVLLGSAACNFPTRSNDRFTAEHLRQTVEAMPTWTKSTLPDDSSTPDAIDTVNRTPDPYPTIHPTPSGAYYEYEAQPGDTLPGIAGRFGVEPEEIVAHPPVPQEGYLPHGQILTIPIKLTNVSSAQRLLPDAELVYSPTASDFDVHEFVATAGGYLSGYWEKLEDDRVISGAAIVQRVANELSINPRLLLALIDYRSGWLYDHPVGADQERYPLGFKIPGRYGLYEELKVAGTQLNTAYYGWRKGEFTRIQFPGARSVRLHPSLNAGTAALMHLFTFLSRQEGWEDTLYGPWGFPVRYQSLFGDTWARAEAIGPLLPWDLNQPEMELPIPPGEYWSLTGGPHNAWNAGTPRGALDLSPITDEDPCAVSERWAVAVAPGVVARSVDNVLALDLDGDGYEGTGWVMVYFHLAEEGLIPLATSVTVDQPLGHPSCEGGRTTGTHLHIARKYNGEWLPVDGPVPLVLSGWQVEAGERLYQGTLVRGDQVVTADPSGRSGSTVRR